MTLPTSGSISMSAINTELGYSATATLGLNSAAPRALAGIGSGPISLGSFRGKSNVVLNSPAYAVSLLGLVGSITQWAMTGWPDASSYWIWNEAGAAGTATSNSTVRMQAEYDNNTGADLAVTMYCAVDNSGTLYLNNVAILNFSGWSTQSVAVTIPPGKNLISMICTNATGAAGAAFSMIGSAGVLLRSGSSFTYY